MRLSDHDGSDTEHHDGSITAAISDGSPSHSYYVEASLMTAVTPRDTSGSE
jgi:hypothetical protein